MQRKISKLTEELNLMKVENKRLKKELNKTEDRTVRNVLNDMFYYLLGR